jgi:transmembrane sensor
MMPGEDEVSAVIAEQAGEWFIANQAGALTAHESAAFLAWLKSSPLHVKEYLEIARIARGWIDAVRDPQVPLESFLAQTRAAADRVVALEPRTDRHEGPPSRLTISWGMPLLATAAALLSLAVGVLWWVHDGQLLGIPKTYRTAHGRQETRRLPDGSILRLDTESEVTVRYSRKERLVEVDRGQALFQVAHENSRRFRVAAGVTGVIAVGTQFDIYQHGGETAVTVAEGQVAVFTGKPAWLLVGEDAPADVQRIKAGYQMRVDASGLSAQPVQVDLAQTLAWLEHKITFKDRPLGEVAAEFNRYGPIPVEIEDSTLQGLPVTGMLDASDTDSFVAFLETLPGMRVERTPTGIKVKALPTP